MNRSFLSAGRWAAINTMVLGTTIFAAAALAEEAPLFRDVHQPVEARVEDLLSRLTPDEKISILHGDSKFTTAAIPRLGIPRRWISDGPNGVREDIGPDTWKPMGHTDDFATALPCGIALASTWSPELGMAYGQTIGEEARARGKNIMLGPGVNIQRTPLNGRNFEYMGEDPFLTSRMAVADIKGIQREGVGACVKHFACNNQEFDRGTIDVEVDERPLREIYLPAFKAAVQEAHVMCVMGAYNQLRGNYCAQNDLLLNKILKGECGFTGLVMSDWGAVHETRAAVLGGLDLEMGTEGRPYDDDYLARPFLDGIKSGQYPTSLLDDKVRRNLRVMFATGVIDGREPGALNTLAHQLTARRIAEESMVLLKNESGLLPLDAKTTKSIAVIGENAVRKLCHSGGSSEIKAFYEITPLQGIVERAGTGANVCFSMGYARKATDTADLVARAVAAAKQADVAIIVAGLNHSRYLDSEGTDRKDLSLPYGQDELIRQVSAANPHTIVVLMSGGATDMNPWLAQVPAVLQAWYPGMEGGNALARVLFGDANPSGKLPCTFPKQLEDSPAHAMGNYPGTDGVEHYAEGLLVGYRYYDTKNVEPLFPFGYGLSYTKFDYDDLQLAPGSGEGQPVVTVKANLRNSGDREGAEVVQVYVRPVHPSVERPVKELKGFTKLLLTPGQSSEVSIPLNRGAFAFYDPQKQGWVAEKGDYEILVGSSSQDIRLKGMFSLTDTTVEK